MPAGLCFSSKYETALFPSTSPPFALCTPFSAHPRPLWENLRAHMTVPSRRIPIITSFSMCPLLIPFLEQKPSYSCALISDMLHRLESTFVYAPKICAIISLTDSLSESQSLSAMWYSLIPFFALISDMLHRLESTFVYAPKICAIISLTDSLSESQSLSAMWYSLIPFFAHSSYLK